MEKALHTQRKAAAAEAVGRSARSSTFRILPGRVVQPKPITEPLQQATADGQSAVVLAISDVGGGRRYAVPSANEGVATLTHVAAREEDDASTRLTRALEFDPEMMRVAYATGLSMLYVLVLSILYYSTCVVGFVYGLGAALKGEATTPLAKNCAGCLVCVASCAVHPRLASRTWASRRSRSRSSLARRSCSTLSAGIVFFVIAWKLMLPHQRRQPVIMLRMLASCWTFPLLAVVVVVIMVKTAQRSVSGEVVGGLILLMATLVTVHINVESMHRFRKDSIVHAMRTAETIESAVSDSQITTATVTERLALETQKKSSWWQDLIHIV